MPDPTPSLFARVRLNINGSNQVDGIVTHVSSPTTLNIKTVSDTDEPETRYQSVPKLNPDLPVASYPNWQYPVGG